MKAKKNHKPSFLSNMIDTEEKESREVSQFRREDKERFMETARNTISVNGFITPMQ